MAEGIKDSARTNLTPFYLLNNLTIDEFILFFKINNTLNVYDIQLKKRSEKIQLVKPTYAYRILEIPTVLFYPILTQKSFCNKMLWFTM